MSESDGTEEGGSETFSETSWKEILDLWYDEEVIVWGLPWDYENVPSVFREELDYSNGELVRTMAYMKHVGVIENVHDDEKNPMYGLSTKGVEIAHDREHTKRRHQQNENMQALTVALAISGAIQAVNVLPTPNWFRAGATASLLVALLLCVGWVTTRWQ